MNDDIKLLIADSSFFDTFFKIKSETKNIYWSGHKEKPNYNTLRDWYINQLLSENRIIFKIEYKDLEVGYLYFDILKNKEIELSYAVSELYEGLGIASSIVELVVIYKKHYYSDFIIKAYVADINIASQRVMLKNLFIKSNFSYKEILKLENKGVNMEEFILKDSVFIIAEAGVNHNGDINLAKQLIDIAVEAKVDAVKFQTWKTELLVTKEAKQAIYQRENTNIEESQYDMIKKLELSYDEFRELKAYCDERNIMFLSTADETTSADFLLELQDIFKIGSGELTNLPYLRHIGSFKKRIILSTGMGNLGEIEDALDVLTKAGTAKENITILHANTQYPTIYEDVNLKAMVTIGSAFDVSYGYSDHTLGIEVPIGAVAMGATVFEKHFTLDKDMKGPDHKASLDPTELKAMVKAMRNMEIALGSSIKKPSKSEIPNIAIARKSIVASCDIKKGELFKDTNIYTKRVANRGISPMKWDDIIDTKAMRDYKEDELI